MHWLAGSLKRKHLSVWLCVALLRLEREIDTMTAFHLNRDEISRLNPGSSDLSVLEPTNLVQPTTTSLHLTGKDLLGKTNPRSDQVSCRDHGLSLVFMLSLSNPTDCESSTRPSDASIAIPTPGESLVASKRTEFLSFRFYLSKSFSRYTSPYTQYSTISSRIGRSLKAS